MKKKYSSNQVLYYFIKEWKLLVFVSITGIIYNIGLAGKPYLEGQLVGCLNEILKGNQEAKTMLLISCIYFLALGLVQICRYYKRLGVRKFANRTAKEMKITIYHNILNRTSVKDDTNSIGNIMTKAIHDADSASEGMRKFTTEVFDTGIVLLTYISMLLYYDWRLTLICLLFMPLAYIIAERTKALVTKYTNMHKEAIGALNNNTLERIQNALLYRVYGLEENRSKEYNQVLNEYEHKSILANMWENTMAPIYTLITLLGSGFIIYFGARNVLGIGWSHWDIAAFTTYLACFEHLAKKAGKSAKLFNNVQKARVSWKRIYEYLDEPICPTIHDISSLSLLEMKNVAFGFDHVLGKNISLTLQPGDILGVSGDIASGKSAFGKIFIHEVDYQGSIQYQHKDINALWEQKDSFVGYLGHNVELFNDTIENNIKQGIEGDITSVLHTVCLDEDLKEFPEGIHTMVGEGGIRLSGGQQARLALARTLYHSRPLLILDDPFSALDQTTEKQIYENLRKEYSDKIIILISHRLVLFSYFNQVVWLDGNNSVVGTHDDIYKQVKKYQEYYDLQEKGGKPHEIHCL